MAVKTPTIKLESMNDILGGNGSLDKSEIDIASLVAYPQHKYKLYDGERLKDMVDSILAHGVIMPIIVWRNDNQNIILSGHNRANAARLAGLKTIPCILKENLSDSEAASIVHETNLIQRSFSDLSHSEKAYCLVQHYENMKAQGKRTDKITELENLIFSQQNTPNINEKTTCVQIEHKLRNGVASNYGLSATNFSRYIRLGTNLSPSLFMLLDKEQIAFNAAYLVSFLSKELQDILADLLDNEGYNLDLKKAELLKAQYENGQLRDITIVQILTDTKKQSHNNGFKVSPKIMIKFFNATNSKKEIETIIEQALENYFKEEY